MGGQRFTSTSTDVFEPADPARTMPKSLVIGAILAVVVLVVLMSWLNRRSLDQTDQPVAAVTNTPPVAAPVTAPPASTTTPAQGAVVLTATAPVWLQVSERGGASLFSGTLQPGQTYAVPATATAPVLKTGKPEALTVTVGTTNAPPVGPAATTVANVSLIGADLLKTPAVTAAPSVPAGRRAPAAAPVPAPAPVETIPATNNGQ
jgi:cytoskeleton protein RodZ